MARLGSHKMTVNGIEALLGELFDTPTLKPTFYQVLIDSPVYLISAEHPTDFTVPISYHLQCVNVQKWQIGGGSFVIPFFTSAFALSTGVAAKADLQCLPTQVGFSRSNANVKRHVMRTRTLFENTRGIPLILNPYGSHCVQFLPADVDLLLQGVFSKHPEM